MIRTNKLSKLQKAILKHLYKDKVGFNEFQSKYDNVKFKYLGESITKLSYEVGEALGYGIWTKKEHLKRLEEEAEEGKISYKDAFIFRSIVRSDKKDRNLKSVFVASISRSLKRLEKRGLVKRHISDDVIIMLHGNVSPFRDYTRTCMGSKDYYSDGIRFYRSQIDLMNNEPIAENICPLCDSEMEKKDGNWYCSKCGGSFEKSKRIVSRKRTTRITLTKECKEWLDKNSRKLLTVSDDEEIEG